LTLDKIVNLTNNEVTIHTNTEDIYEDGTGGKEMPVEIIPENPIIDPENLQNNSEDQNNKDE